MKETIKMLSKLKAVFFEKIIKTDKPLARLIRKKERRILEMKKERLQQTM